MSNDYNDSTNTINVPVKMLKGLQSNLDNKSLNEGSIYFCVDTENIFVDVYDNDNNLVRKQVSAVHPTSVTLIDGSVVSIDSAVSKDWLQNASTQPDYIKNRTHWKEVNGEGVTYHKLPNEYLNIDSAPTQDSKNLVSSGAVYTAINNLPSGDGTIYVNLSEDSDGNLTADKTLEEIKSLIQANKEIIVIYDTIQFHYSYNGDNVLVFSSGAASVQFSLMCVAGAWNFVRTELASLEKVEKLEQVQIDVIESNETFTADVTFEQIKTYYNDGRKIVVQHGNVILPLAAIGTNTSEEIMSFLFAQTVERSLIQVVCSDGIWFVEETELITASSVTTELSANSHNGEIPAAKTVYDSIQAVKETIPAVPSWALQETKPAYTATEVGAEAAGTAAFTVTAHNTNTEAHNDMRLLIKDLTDRLNALADSDDTTLDQMSEIVAYIKNNKSLIDNITTTKVNVADIINNLTTNVADKPLSAAQGVALKALIDAITVPTALSQLTDDATHRTVTDTEKTAWNAKSNFSGSYNDLTNKPNIVIGDKSYKIVVSSTPPTVDDRSVITIVI